MIQLTSKQLAAINAHFPAAASVVAIQPGPSVAEEGTFTVDYLERGTRGIIVSYDVARDGTLNENEVD